MRFKSESFSNAASQWGRRHTKGSGSKHTKQKRTGHLVLPTQSAKSQTTQAACDITEESAMFCCRTTSRLRRRNGPAPRSRRSGFLAQSHLAGYLGDEGAARHCTSFPGCSAILSRASERAVSARRSSRRPDSSARCDVNANDTSAVANV